MGGKNLQKYEVVELKMKNIKIIYPILTKKLESEFPNQRDIPEIFLFISYLRSLEEEGKINFKQKNNKNKKNLFIPASNGGSIAALAILFSLSQGHLTFVREPTNGFGPEMDILLNLFEDVSIFKERLKIINAKKFNDTIKNKKFSLLLAWGSNKTKKDIEEIAENTSSKLFYFGTQISLSIIDLDELYLFDDSKKRRIIDGYISDILTFDQNGCTNTKFSILISNNKKTTQKFFNQINFFAKKSRFNEAISLQEKLSGLIRSSGLQNPQLMERKFFLSDRIWFIRIKSLYPNLLHDLDNIKSGVVIYKSVNDLKDMLQLLHSLPNFGRITSFSSQFSILQKEKKVSEYLSRDILNIGFSNSLNYIWDDVDLSSIFK